MYNNNIANFKKYFMRKDLEPFRMNDNRQGTKLEAPNFLERKQEISKRKTQISNRKAQIVNVT